MCVAVLKKDTERGQKERAPDSLSVSQSVSKQETQTKRKKRQRQQTRRGAALQFRQSCVDNFPGADLVKEAISGVLLQWPFGCSDCFRSDALPSVVFFLCRQQKTSSVHCEDGDLQPWNPSAQALWWYEWWVSWRKHPSHPQTPLLKDAKRYTQVKNAKTGLQRVKSGVFGQLVRAKNACTRQRVTALFCYVYDTNEGTCSSGTAAYACWVQVCHV